MAKEFSISITLGSPEETTLLAQAIAPLLVPGNALLLQGDIGSGKTHFARSLIQSRLATAGIVEDVPSPTFTLVQTYDDGIAEIWHADLYRLSDSSAIVELGLEDAFDSSVCLIEWPEVLGAAAPEDALWIYFQPGRNQQTRVLTFRGDNKDWSNIFPVLRAEVSGTTGQ